MKNRDLIKLLEQYPPDATVAAGMAFGFMLVPLEEVILHESGQSIGERSMIAHDLENNGKYKTDVIELKW